MAEGRGWSIEVNDLGPFPCSVIGGSDDGLKRVDFEVWADLLSCLGATVKLRLSGGGRTAEGEGLVTAVEVPEDGDALSTIAGMGPFRMVPGDV